MLRVALPGIGFVGGIVRAGMSAIRAGMAGWQIMVMLIEQGAAGVELEPSVR